MSSDAFLGAQPGICNIEMISNPAIYLCESFLFFSKLPSKIRHLVAEDEGNLEEALGLHRVTTNHPYYDVKENQIES